MDKFEQWFINQDFYTNMRFIHGDALFIKDRDVYRVLPVQMTWVTWQSRQAEVDLLQQYNDDLAGGQCCLYRELKEKDKRIDELSNLLDRSEINHKHLLTKYQSTKLMEMESSKRLSVIETLIESWRDLKIKGIAPEHRAYEDALNKCADELEKALRGDNA